VPFLPAKTDPIARLGTIFLHDQTITAQPMTASQPKAQHVPTRRRAWRETPDLLRSGAAPHGGTLDCPATTAPGSGSRLFPAKPATTLSVLVRIGALKSWEIQPDDLVSVQVVPSGSQLKHLAKKVIHKKGLSKPTRKA
jgi:hypothetical protein